LNLSTLRVSGSKKLGERIVGKSPGLAALGDRPQVAEGVVGIGRRIIQTVRVLPHGSEVAKAVGPKAGEMVSGTISRATRDTLPITEYIANFLENKILLE
jgi:hypothetical protein